jgi:predicted Zn finger-like uncharacterized protein
VNVTCPSCETVYRVDPTKIPPGGVRARCTVCSNVFPVSADGTGGGRGGGARPAAAAPPPPTAPPAARPPAPAVARPAAPAVARPSGATPRPLPPRPATPAAPPPAPPAPPAPKPAAARPAPPTAPAAPAAPAAPPAPAAPQAPAPAPAGGSTPGKRLTGPLRPVNPFLVQDPKQKARRLARALISDMLVYHPEKRQQGIRDGTLPQLFKDEIQKSWQEYVEQVGQELAQSTPYWTEALNEILAGGTKLF